MAHVFVWANTTGSYSLALLDGIVYSGVCFRCTFQATGMYHVVHDEMLGHVRRCHVLPLQVRVR